ncbi:MAG TPA: ABC transporter ATP-binding protein [Ilumatobacteraceae bacterium]|nr:ABC transporter ATP-binding protein [Ilumatobacteraceae bacterium]
MDQSGVGADAGVPVALATRGVSVQFGGVRALDDVTISIGRGEVCGLIGPNGAGKTTLFDVLSGVRSPKLGRIELHGEDVTDKSATWRARNGMRRTFQRQQVFGGLTVEDNVLTALEWEGGGGGFLADMIASPARRRRERNRRAQVRNVLSTFRVDSMRDDAAGTVPIGAARELEVARAIVARPSVLLLDEPTSGLDESERDRLGEIIQAERSRGTAVVLVEHDVEFVMAQCDRIVVLNLGEVIADDVPAEIRKNPAVLAAYLS